LTIPYWKQTAAACCLSIELQITSTEQHSVATAQPRNITAQPLRSEAQHSTAHHQLNIQAPSDRPHSLFIAGCIADNYLEYSVLPPGWRFTH